MDLTLGRHQWRNALRWLACWKLTGSLAVEFLPKQRHSRFSQTSSGGHNKPTTERSTKIFLSNPNRIYSAVVSIFNPSLVPLEGTPTGKRIVQDINRCNSEHLLKIVEAKGVIVENLGSRNGHQWVETGVNRRGVKCTKGPCTSTRWIHPDPRPSMEIFFVDSVIIFLNSNKYISVVVVVRWCLSFFQIAFLLFCFLLFFI